MPYPVALLGPAAVSQGYALSSATFAAVLARMAWNRLPAWIQQDVSVRNLLSKKANDNSSEELANLASVIEKLQALVRTGSARLREEEPSGNKQYLQVALLAFIQLSAQLHKRYPEARNERYRAAGTSVQGLSPEIQEYLNYAIWAYEADTKTLEEWMGDEFTILQHSAETVRPGHVGHFVAVSSRKKLMVVGLKGTSTLEEMLTDCCGRAVNYHHYDTVENCVERVEVTAAGPVVIEEYDDVKDGPRIEIAGGYERVWVHGEGDDDAIRCHEGILISALRLVSKVQPLIEEWILSKQEGYKLVIVGHSLGAGAAILLAVILRHRLSALTADDDLMRVVGYAPPPTLDHDSALAAAAYTTSVVNNSDLIPRCSLVNLAVFLEFLKTVSARLVERGLVPVNPKSTVALIRKLAQGTTGDLLMTSEEVQLAMDTAQRAVELRNPDHLYVPGRVLLMCEEWKSSLEAEGDDGSETSTTAEGKINTERTRISSSARASITISSRQFVETDGAAAVLRFFELDGYKMLTDHATASYSTNIDCAEAGNPLEEYKVW